jgi:hypothetical protein
MELEVSFPCSQRSTTEQNEKSFHCKATVMKLYLRQQDYLIQYSRQRFQNIRDNIYEQ